MVDQDLEHAVQALYQDVNVYHAALNDLLPLFIQACGRDYSCVDKALEALQRHPELPIAVALEDYIALQSQGVDILPMTMKVLDANGKELSRQNTFIGKREE